MSLTLEEKKELLVDHIDPDFFVEVFNITTSDLVEAFEDTIADKWEQFKYLEEGLTNDYEETEET